MTSVNPDQEESYSKFSEKIKNSHVEVLKNAKYEQISSLYSKAKIYWHGAGYLENLQKHPERAEHFGMSTVEAMASGAVPIVINAGGQPEIVKDNDNGYLWNDIETLIDKTHKIAVDKDLFKRISDRAIETSQSFNSVRFCEELNHLIW